MHFTFSIHQCFIRWKNSATHQIVPHTKKAEEINRFPLIFQQQRSLFSPHATKQNGFGVSLTWLKHFIQTSSFSLFRCAFFRFVSIRLFINRMNYCLINIANKLYWIGNIFIDKTPFQQLLNAFYNAPTKKHISQFSLGPRNWDGSFIFICLFWAFEIVCKILRWLFSLLSQ